jgi:hypothetical protein
MCGYVYKIELCPVAVDSIQHRNSLYICADQATRSRLFVLLSLYILIWLSFEGYSARRSLKGTFQFRLLSL